MKNGMLALCAALISAGIAADAQEWLGDGYANRMRLNLTEKAAAGNLENFPVCVRLNGDELFSKIKPDGSDLTFTSADGKTVLPHEIESMDAAKKELICWVRLPVIQQKKETPFYLYFNNPGAQSKHDPVAVWSNGYLAVWHMNGKRQRAGQSRQFQSDIEKRSRNCPRPDRNRRGKHRGESRAGIPLSAGRKSACSSCGTVVHTLLLGQPAQKRRAFFL